jgi:hypothetical protein
VREKVYERVVTENGGLRMDVTIRVYTTIVAGGAREKGADAIRVTLAHRQTGKPVWSATRTHRTQNWKERMLGRMREAWKAASGLPRCSACGLPMVLRTSSKGAEFLGCAGYPVCRSTYVRRIDELV